MKVCYFGTYESNCPRNQIIIKGLKKNNIQVVECHLPVWESRKGKPVNFQNISSLVRFCFRILGAYILLPIKYCQVGKHDFVIVGFPGQIDIFLAKALTFFSRKPLIFDPFMSFYDTFIFDKRIVKRKSLLAKLLYLIDKYSCEMADLILLDTKEHIKYFSKMFYINKNKFCRIFVGADEDIFYPRVLEKRNREKFVVLFYGKFIPLQGISYIIKAAKLLEKQTEIRFKIIGFGQLSAKIKDFSRRLNVKNIIFIDWVEYQDLPKHIAEASLCLGIFGKTAKAKRVIPNKAFQALAMKKPVITGDSPAAREALINEENALLCRMGDAEAIARSILLLKKNRKLRERISDNGYKLYQREFTSSVIGKKVKNCLAKRLHAEKSI